MNTLKTNDSIFTFFNFCIKNNKNDKLQVHLNQYRRLVVYKFFDLLKISIISMLWEIVFDINLLTHFVKNAIDANWQLHSSEAVRALKHLFLMTGHNKKK